MLVYVLYLRCFLSLFSRAEGEGIIQSLSLPSQGSLFAVVRFIKTPFLQLLRSLPAQVRACTYVPTCPLLTRVTGFELVKKSPKM
jgi:hypothetical protein